MLDFGLNNPNPKFKIHNQKLFYFFSYFRKKTILLIDLSFTSGIQPAKGKILISDPFLDEDYFRRSVLYLCEHNKDGSFGFVLNNFININLHELDETFPEIQTHISIGGPIESNSLYFVHTLGDKIQNSIHVHDGIYLGGDFQELSNLVKEDITLINQIRFFIGYAGWSPNQLDDEIAKNAWLVVKLKSKDDLFSSTNKHSWKSYMEGLGGKFKIISKFPLDPRDN